MVYSVALDDGGPSLKSLDEMSVAAEPNSSVLILAGGVLCLVAGAMKRIRRSDRGNR